MGVGTIFCHISYIVIVPQNTMAGERKKGVNGVVLTFAGLCLLNLAASLDALGISPALPAMATSLHANSVQAYWFGK